MCQIKHVVDKYLKIKNQQTKIGKISTGDLYNFQITTIVSEFN